MSNPILDPVEGITLEQWAEVNAKLASGTPAEEAIKSIAADMPKWDRVNNEWLTRMRNDTTFTISNKYAAAFNKGASGNLGSGSQVSADSFPFEKYIEVMVAQDVLGKQGRDAQDVLKDFGLTVADYSNISSYWSGKMMSDFSLAAKMAQLDAEFRKKYQSMAPGSAHSDIEF
ncbi:MAG: DUF6620 family protein [Ignavibacteria bacterium]|jgi:hypothetical protein